MVNWFEIEIINANGETTYRNSFVTDLPVGADTVVELAACGRAQMEDRERDVQRSEEQGLQP